MTVEFRHLALTGKTAFHQSDPQRRLQPVDRIRIIVLSPLDRGGDITALAVPLLNRPVDDFFETQDHLESLDWPLSDRVFVGLHELGARPKIVDVGGGLGVDYDGSKTNFHSSKDYSTQEYANDVVASIQEACDEAGVPHPVPMQERAGNFLDARKGLRLDRTEFGKVDNWPRRQSQRQASSTPGRRCA